MTRMKSIPRILVSFGQGLPVVYLGKDKKDQHLNPNGGSFVASDPRDAKGGSKLLQVTLRWDDSMGCN